MSRWKIRHTLDEATIEVAFLFQNADVEREIKRILSLLILEDDPRRPKLSSNLDVAELEFDAPGWFRVKVPRYGIRIVFRLLEVHGKDVVEVTALQPINKEIDERYIDITQAGYRKDVYGAELRKRFKKMGGTN